MRSASIPARPIAAALMLLALGSAASGAAEPDLYEYQTIVTGEREETRIPGFAECLEFVLVKVSGDPRLIGDPRVAEMARQAGTFVRSFRYHDRMSGIPHHDEQGTRDRPYDLIVAFDRASIDAALHSLGRAPWTAARPLLAVFLGMRNLTTDFMLAADGDRVLEREALMAAAAMRGMPMTLATQAAIAKAGVTFETLPTADLMQVAAAANALGGALPLVGRMIWNADSLAWVATWRLGAGDRVHEWKVISTTFDEGFRKAIGGASQLLSGHEPPR